MAYTIWIGKEFDYSNGENNPGFLLADGHFDGKNGMLYMECYLENSNIEDVRVKFFFDYELKIATVMSMEWIHWHPKKFSLKDLPNFFFRERLITAIKNVILSRLGFFWRMRLYYDELHDDILERISHQKYIMQFKRFICDTLIDDVYNEIVKGIFKDLFILVDHSFRKPFKTDYVQWNGSAFAYSWDGNEAQGFFDENSGLMSGVLMGNPFKLNLNLDFRQKLGTIMSLVVRFDGVEQTPQTLSNKDLLDFYTVIQDIMYPYLGEDWKLELDI